MVVFSSQGFVKVGAHKGKKATLSQTNSIFRMELLNRYTETFPFSEVQSALCFQTVESNNEKKCLREKKRATCCKLALLKASIRKEIRSDRRKK